MPCVFPNNHHFFTKKIKIKTRKPKEHLGIRSENTKPKVLPGLQVPEALLRYFSCDLAHFFDSISRFWFSEFKLGHEPYDGDYPENDLEANKPQPKCVDDDFEHQDVSLDEHVVEVEESAESTKEKEQNHCGCLLRFIARRA